MEIKFSNTARNHLDFFVKSGNKKALKKITQLIQDIQRHPYEGIGKPEQLKLNWSGYWSRRINLKDRLIYKVEDNKLFVYSLLGHYD